MTDVATLAQLWAAGATLTDMGLKFGESRGDRTAKFDQESPPAMAAE